MDQTVQDAIETVDNARQHKCELEGRRKQLISAISQVSNTAEITRQEVERYFELMLNNLTEVVQVREKELLKEIDAIEREALDPLKDCKTLVEEGIEEATTVIASGEGILNEDMDTEVELSNIKKFITMTDSLALDSVPEVPSAVDVPSISIMFGKKFIKTLSIAVQNEGVISRQSPVQIVNLEAIPGGIVVSWAENDENDSFENNPKTNYLYRLQGCHGKILSGNIKLAKDQQIFKDEYVGPNLSHAVKNLVANALYTFRVCRCKYEDNGTVLDQWSPWSIYQEKMTLMPGFKWMMPKDEVSYVLSEKNKVAVKKSSLVKVLYSEVSAFIVGFQVTLKIDVEGKLRNKFDCIGLCTKRDMDATSMHTKEGTLCMMSDGRTWINGVCSKTRFLKFSRGMIISFFLEKSEENLADTKNRLIKYRVSLTVGDYQAVFNWVPSKSGLINPQNLSLFVLLQSSGWKVSLI